MEAEATDKVIQIDTLRRLANFVIDRLALLDSPRSPGISITGKFTDGSTYSNDSIDALNHPAFENRSLKSVSIEGKMGYSAPIYISIDKHEIRYKISSSGEEWVTSSSAALEAIIGSIPSIDISESFFYKHPWIRYFLLCFSSFTVSLFLIFILIRAFPNLKSNYYLSAVSLAILIPTIYFFDHRMPGFREL